jgi:3-dehydroquinate dehydratase-2
VKTILLISGPNLNLLGERETDVYGDTSLDEYVALASSAASVHGYGLVHHQYNDEGNIVEEIHSARNVHEGIIINPGALTHYGWSIHDALAAFDGPVIELHISNPNAREAWRHTSVVAPVATGSIIGLGKFGYELAVNALVDSLK